MPTDFNGHSNGTPRPPSAALDEMPHYPQLTDFIDQHFGQVTKVFHEIQSHLIHLDVHIIEPTPAQNFYTLVTTGMSYLPMNTPPPFTEYRFAELLICLPPDWPLDEASLHDETHYWPIRLLKSMARFPHENDTWLSFGHTVTNGQPAEPYAENIEFSGVILTPPEPFSEDSMMLEIDEDKTVFFFMLMPLYLEELHWAQEQGAEMLFEDLDKHNINGIVDINRPSVSYR